MVELMDGIKLKGAKILEIRRKRRGKRISHLATGTIVNAAPTTKGVFQIAWMQEDGRRNVTTFGPYRWRRIVDQGVAVLFRIKPDVGTELPDFPPRDATEYVIVQQA